MSEQYIKTIPEILHSMGYREMKENLFGKPIAFSLFIILILEDSIKWMNRFKVDDKILVWDSKTISKEDFTIEFIKDCENEAAVAFHGYNTSFEFGL